MRAWAKTVASVSAGALGLLGLAIAPASAVTAHSVSAKAAKCYAYNGTKSALNVHSGPGQRYTTIGTIAKGGKLPCGRNGDSSITGQQYRDCGWKSDRWGTVKINGQDGWVAYECVAFGI
ncbi:SH3 domain-containing protein [Streptomyces nigrescens]